MIREHALFADRAEAGRRLAERLQARGFERPVIFALPRGGVPVGFEIAKALGAPLDLVLVRKIGAPGWPELALAAVVDGENAQTVVNESVMQMTGAGDAFLDKARAAELAEIERRRARYFGSHRRADPQGRVCIVVDDGLATGATAKAALGALRRQGATRVVLAIPVAPTDTLAEMRAEADEVICLHPAEQFQGVGAFYRDFHQLTDEETIGLLRQAWSDDGDPPAQAPIASREARVGPLGLGASVQAPPLARGVVLFAHGSGSSRFSPRNVAVAEALNGGGLATVLLDLLTEAEAADRRNVFDIPLLAQRLVQAVRWIEAEPGLAGLKVGLFGASTGAGAALAAAAELGPRVSAVVSRGGRPDLAGASALQRVSAPTLLIVGGADHGVIELNRQALAELRGEKALELVPDATHLFEEPGTLERVMTLAGEWFGRHLAPSPAKAPPKSPAAVLRDAAQPLPPIDDPAFAAAFDRFADAKVVLLGEASHGTSEFYRARDAITRRLIERHGFSIVAAEADWPDAAAIDRHVRMRPHRPMQPPPFSRFPTWMWRNTDVHHFVDWLRAYNARLPDQWRAGFYGLDLYSMSASIAAVLEYLDRIDPEAAAVARERYACLTRWKGEPAAYGRAALTQGYALCEQAVVAALRELLAKRLDYAAGDGERFLDAAQNARLVADAERYYRAMYLAGEESWNLRDRHMFETLVNILASRGPKAKAVVWAHNSHIGDARFTDMGEERGELNIGQLCRERFGDDAALIGFGTDRGTVAAASDWDGPMEIKAVRPARPDSYEALFHEAGLERFLIDLDRERQADLRAVLSRPRLERYIGVIYRPETERWSHYSHARLCDQYDAFVWFDETHAITPLPTSVAAGEDETYPFGL
ncbi:MAG: erythromycin esterase family protein [Caulobacterales bacterium]